MSSVFSISVGGMNAAMQRLQMSANNIANASTAASAGNLEQDIVDLMLSRISFAANARVAETAAQTLKTLIDIKV